MKTVKLSIPLLIGDTHYDKDAVVMVTDEQAATLTRAGHAAHQEGDGGGDVANPDHNPLAEAITPMPPGGAVFNPADALAPNVADNPGLAAMAKAVRKGNVKVKDVTNAHLDLDDEGRPKDPEATAVDVAARKVQAPQPTGHEPSSKDFAPGTVAAAAPAPVPSLAPAAPVAAGKIETGTLAPPPAKAANPTGKAT